MEISHYILSFDTVDGEDAFLVPEVALQYVRAGDVELLETLTPHHKEFEFMPEPGPEGHSYREIYDHVSEWEDYLIEEVLSEVESSFDEIIRQCFRYARGGGDLRKVAAVIKDMG